MKIKKIACIGAGFVGGPTMAVIALKCPEIKIMVVDNNKDKIDLWNGDSNSIPVYEPGLPEIINKVRNKNLFFTSDIKNAIDQSQMIFVAVNTPTKTKGEGKGYAADLSNIENCAKQILKFSNNNKIVVEKSTLPVKTAEKLKEILNRNKKGLSFDILSNPEFLAEGTAIKDLFKSDRVLIGGENSVSGKAAVEKLKEIYLKWIPKNKIIITSVWSSELSKLVSNAFLAQRISSINSISAICEKTGADIIEISKAIGMDKRIGSKFLNSSIGFGGSCFKKDILNLVYLAKTYKLNEIAEYWESVITINSFQTNRIADKIIEYSSNLNSDKTITVLGWSFKKNTNDSRESASIYLTAKLLNNGFKVKIYDPMIKKEKIFSDLLNNSYLLNNVVIQNVEVFDNKYMSFIDSSFVVICTEWDEFIQINWVEVYNKMKNQKYIIDGRNILDVEKLKKIGFKIYSIGRT